MKKRISAILLSLLLVAVTFAGCGNSAPAAPQASSPNSTPAAGNETAAPAETSGEVVTLNFPCIWVGTDSKAEVFGKMVAEFNEMYAGQYEIKIEDQTDYDAYRDKIRTQLSTGSAPDLFTLDSKADLRLFSESGKLMDLTEFLAGPVNERFSSGQVAASQINGLNYAVPYEMAVVPIMMNKKLFDAAGAAIPTSYEELWDACEKLKANGVFPMGQMTANNAWFSMHWYSYALAAAGGPDVYANGLDNPAFEKAAELMMKEFQYTSSDAIGADASVVNGHFFNERAAVYTNGTWILGRIRSEAVEGTIDNLEISPGFSLDGKNGGAYVTGIQAFVAAGKQDDPNKKAAVEAFLEHITDTGRLVELANSSGALFAVNLNPADINDPMLAKIVQQLSEAAFTVNYFQSEMPTPVANEFPPALEALVLGDITPAEFVEQLKAANV